MPLTPKDRPRLFAELNALAAYYNRPPLSAEVFAMYWDDLSDLDLEIIRHALRAHRNNPNTKVGGFMPTASHIRAAISGFAENDGRPGPEEAWALVPKDEETSVVMTEEMAAAAGAARPLIEGGD